MDWIAAIVATLIIVAVVAMVVAIDHDLREDAKADKIRRAVKD